jgi:hypothetical protein
LRARFYQSVDFFDVAEFLTVCAESICKYYVAARVRVFLCYGIYQIGIFRIEFFRHSANRQSSFLKLSAKRAVKQYY